MFPAQRATLWAARQEARAVQAVRVAPPAVPALSRAVPVRVGLPPRQVSAVRPAWLAARAKLQPRATLVPEVALPAQREEPVIPAKARSSVMISKRVLKAHSPRVGRCLRRATVRPWDWTARGS
jgi:hypothetical protein